MDINSFKIRDINVTLPIIQGGMGVGISLSSLASAVATEGGIGVISTAGIGMNEPDFTTNYVEANSRALKKEIRKAKELTKGILGVNIMVALSNFDDLVRTAIEEGIDVIFSGAGLPLDLPSFLHGTTKTKLVPIISSKRAAGIIIKRWLSKYDYLPDALVVEGTMAGGHLGFKEEQLIDDEYSLEKLIPQVIREVAAFEEIYKRAIPVIAAGGIYSGEDIFRFMNIGASAVQMATRFVTTNECDASIEFKKAYINAKKEDIVIINSPVGMHGRAIRNEFIDDVKQEKRHPIKCLYHCIKTCDYQTSPYCIANALINAQRGYLKSGFAFAGENAYRSNELVSVSELVNSLLKEYVIASKVKPKSRGTMNNMIFKA